MYRRSLIAISIASLAGCFSNDQSDIDTSRKFSDFSIFNKTAKEQELAVNVKRDGREVINDDIVVAPGSDSQLIDRIGKKTGLFNVSVSGAGDEADIPVTKKAEGDEYSLIIIINENGIKPFLSS